MKIKKYYSQYFLNNKIIINKIINNLKKFKNNYDCILEIGPGYGSLSNKLITLNKKIILIEIDKDLVNILKKKFIKIKNNIIHKDILKCKLKKFGYKKYYIIGNFPYNISKKLLFWIIKNKNYIVECLGMFQKELVNSIIAKKGKIKTKLSVFLQIYFKLKKLFNIKNINFYPIPKVNSSVIKITNKNYNLKIKNKNNFFNFIKECFKHKRKIIKNSLSNIIKINNKIIINNNLFYKRAEELKLKDFIYLYNFIYNNN
ncbi:MAG: 16S rRNA (adenine(1518)-N(6)/adenine(1519)-N(6))-dimethyltransferase RsmA [Candidatus Shikimatogenerans bostrichidophilus]|nr:MAG: 16S rRNA (adenine(1518)-N(6)/adenine(1519)-N(6))-dimethyltransferase RsmA [Candidatus Shikimatogenerans bostrichidophilus]